MTRHMTSSVHAEHPLPINLVKLLALSWPFTPLPYTLHYRRS